MFQFSYFSAQNYGFLRRHPAALEVVTGKVNLQKLRFDLTDVPGERSGVVVRRGQAAIVFSLVIGMGSRNVCIGVNVSTPNPIKCRNEEKPEIERSNIPWDLTIKSLCRVEG